MQNSTSSINRTLLLVDPALSSHPEVLDKICAPYDRNVTDIQMMDRVATGAALLSKSLYQNVVILRHDHIHAVDDSFELGNNVLDRVVASMKPQASLISLNKVYGSAESGADRREAVLAGLIYTPGVGFVKPSTEEVQAVPLNFRRKKATLPADAASKVTTPPSPGLKRKSESIPHLPAGVGLVSGDQDSDEELIDEDDLLDEEEKAAGVVQRMYFQSCQPFIEC